MTNEGVRLNKFLSEAGACSRREADRQIEAGNVTIDGVVAEMGSKVMPGQTVCYNGRILTKEEEKQYIKNSIWWWNTHYLPRIKEQELLYLDIEDMEEFITYSVGKIAEELKAVE